MKRFLNLLKRYPRLNLEQKLRGLEEHLAFTSYLYATDLEKHITPHHFRVGGEEYVEAVKKLRKILFACKVAFNIAVIVLTIGAIIWAM